MAKLSPFPTGQELDDNGNPLAGGTVDFYEAGTSSTRKAAYTSQDESTALANPATFDSAGRMEIWLGDGAYRIVVKDSAGNLIDERDNIIGDLSTSFLGSTFEISANTIINTGYQNGYIVATGTIVLSLLAASSAGSGFSLIVQNTGSGTITIDPDGSETVGGAASLVLGTDEWAILSCDGSNWNAAIFRAGLKISSNDTDFGFLEDKLVAGDGIDLTVNNDGANETITIETEGDLAQYDILRSNTFGGATINNVNSAANTKVYIDTEIAADSIYKPVAVVSLDGTGATGAKTIAAGFGLTANKDSTGNYTFTFDDTMDNSDYSISVESSAFSVVVSSRSTTTFTIGTRSSGGAAADADYISVVIFGEKA